MILQQCKLNVVVFWFVSTIHISVIQCCRETCWLHIHDTLLQNKFRRKWNNGKLTAKLCNTSGISTVNRLLQKNTGHVTYSFLFMKKQQFLSAQMWSG